MGWQTVLRARDLYGPYERRIVLETGSTDVNGPHQGAIVDTPDGQWWFLHFQIQDPLGRAVHLQPMRWEDGWPVMGEDYDGNGIGEPVAEWTKPSVRHRVSRPFLPASSDTFDGPSLGLQWQWNHNPVDSAWSLTSHPGCLALHALPAERFEMARNTLSQKIMGFRGSYTVCLDLSEMADGQFAGLACMGKENIRAGIFQMNGCKVLFAGHLGTQKFRGDTIWFRLTFDVSANVFQFSWSCDGKQFTDIGDPFEMHFGFWKGARVGLFSYSAVIPDCNTNVIPDLIGDLPSPGGTALFDDFAYVRAE